ncbi:hypothetical protein PDR89_27555 [Bacillus cereus group sp. Bc002]|uniref:hypothetical protein n=1 Tax=Bacillus TaxID=1386 RepID=UPI000CCC3A67|nr:MULTISPECIES: hypothetical protein [Bacillus]MDA2688854.1 hypothetical protein [Bacillus cereus group sp. Bc030]MDA2783162.1 hypothetical protein [Bacillus cereus group sp. Bc002]MDO3376420.1 hypothetical protein [Bacillus paranthracis]MED1652173.1 hypothetical protein [Bacillus pacificus]PNS32921.1 hypothetical protein C1640_08080 [Bacillus sp. AKBS9]
MFGSKRVKRQVESTLEAFESCMNHIRRLDMKYKFTEQEKLELYKFEYQLKNLSKELSKDLN